MDDRYFMELALKEAKKAYKLGEVPIGAIIVRENKVIAKAFNRREVDKSALSHAEVLAIKEACKELGGWRLIGCTLYVTLEPCLMCAGAIINSRIERVVYAADDTKAGAIRSLYRVLEDPRLNHQVEVVEGILKEESSSLLKQFFAQLRADKKDF
ncbi:MAG TPA: nucleoside deaminase [Firmicutes bacterium]|jgi:tRNA(adenine34) deaminase|nr:nucleoside deaminase [Bacillota bacterium]